MLKPIGTAFASKIAGDNVPNASESWSLLGSLTSAYNDPDAHLDGGGGAGDRTSQWVRESVFTVTL